MRKPQIANVLKRCASAMRRGLFVPFALSLAGCPFAKPTVEDLRRHEIKNIAFWSAVMARPLEERVAAAPDELVDYLRMDNEVNHFDARPEAVPLNPELSEQLKRLLKNLPEAMRKMLAERMVGVFPVKKLGSSAYTDYIRDKDGRPVAAFVGFDVEALARTGNAWLTWKESSPFRPAPPYQLKAMLAEPAEDSVAVGVDFVLTHEFAHVIALNSDVHPLWSLAPKLIDPTDYPFMDVSWAVKDERYVKKVGATHKEPGPIVYYKESMDKPTADMQGDYYEWLAKTDFVTLYAATSPFDDFADSLATYVHTVIWKKPFAIEIYEGDKLLKRHTACWDEERCKAKRRALEEFLTGRAD